MAVTRIPDIAGGRRIGPLRWVIPRLEIGDVVVIASSTEGNTNTIGTPTATGLSFAANEHTAASASHTYNYISAATATADGDNVIILQARTGGTPTFGMAGWCWVLPAADGFSLDPTPAFQTGAGTGTTPSAILSGTSGRSLIFINGDWNARTGTPTSIGTWVGPDYQQAPLFAGFYTGAQVESSASTTFGMTTPASQNWTMLGIEVVGAVTTVVTINEIGPFTARLDRPPKPRGRNYGPNALRRQHATLTAPPVVGATGTAYTQDLAGDLTFTGAQVKQAGKALAGALSFTGSTPVRAITRTLTAGASFTGTVRKLTSRALTGGVSFTGTEANRTGKSLTGAVSFTGAQSKQTGKPLAGGVSFTGSIVRRTARALAGVLSFNGSLSTGASILYTQALTAGLSFVGSVVKRTSRTHTADVTFVGVHQKRTSRAFTAAVGFVGAIAKTTLKPLTGGVSFTGAIRRSTSKNHTAQLSFTGAQSKQTRRSLTASVGFTGRRVINKALTGVLSFAGSLSTLFTQAPTARDITLSVSIDRGDRWATSVDESDRWVTAVDEGDRWAASIESGDRWSISVEGSLQQVIRQSDGAVEYTYPVRVTEVLGEDITADTVLMSLGTSSAPGDWLAADVSSNPTTSSWRVQLLIGGSYEPTPGDYYVWVKVTDTPEIAPRKTPLNVRVL